MADVGALITADNQARVMAETFGHLAPVTEQVYTGTILFTHSGYGDGTMPISADFDDLPDSPWFYHGMCEFLIEHRMEHGEEVEGRVFRWSGAYQFRNWPTEYTEDDMDVVREAGYEHIFTGEFREIPTA